MVLLLKVADSKLSSTQRLGKKMQIREAMKTPTTAVSGAEKEETMHTTAAWVLQSKLHNMGKKKNTSLQGEAIENLWLNCSHPILNQPKSS